MISNIVDELQNALAKKINLIFENKYPIHKDKMQQDLDKPCFFIKKINGEQTRDVGQENRFYWDKQHFDIIGLTPNGESSILNEMSENLYELEYITLSDETLLRAESMRHEIVNGDLHFFIDYNISIKKGENDSISMENYDMNSEVRNEE